MIIGHINQLKKTMATYGEDLTCAFEFMLQTEFKGRHDGKMEIDGERMFCTVSLTNTETMVNRQWESHKRYADIHLLLEGDEELLGFALPSEHNIPVTDRLDNEDYALFDEAENAMEVTLKEGMYIVFFPGELHKPACSRNGVAQIRKVVMKCIIPHSVEGLSTI